MRVCQLSKFYPPFFGGIEKVSVDLSDAYRYLGYESCVICANHDVITETSIEQVDGVKVIRAKSFGRLFSTPLSFSYLIQVFKVRKYYNIFHVHLPNPLANLAVFFIPRKKKVVLHWHSDIIKQKSFMYLYSYFQSLMLKRSDLIIVTSQLYSIHSVYLQPFLHKVKVLPIGIDKAEISVSATFTNELKKKYTNKKIIFSLGRLTYYKGFEYLVEAAEYLSDEYVIIIGGSGELDKSLNELISRKGLTDRVSLIGNISEDKIGSYYSACDLFVLPSVEKSEAFGVVQVEAMSFSKPVVSTDIIGSGVAWVNKDGVSGYVVPPKDAYSIYLAIEKVFSGDNYELLSKGAYSRYKEVFDKKIMFNNLLGIYKEL